MKFIDEVEITVRAGDGGNGCVSFRREKFVPRGGPDGGDGGKGGSIYLVGDRHKESLIDFAYKRIYKAGRGMHGKGNNQTGKDGKDIFIPVPLGTDVYNNEREVLLGEILKDGQRLLVARGGRGGRGNARFKSPVHQTPEEYEEGEPGEVKKIYLELRLLADIGIIGLPNAGKSTLLSKLTQALPKIADYPFTTLSPNLGVLKTEHKSFVMADLPGLIEGAHKGRGLGLRFLRHIERVGLLIFLIDITRPDPVDDFRMLMNEVNQYKPEILNKPRLVVFNKIDLLADKLEFDIAGERLFYISALKGKNLKELTQELLEKFK